MHISILTIVDLVLLFVFLVSGIRIVYFGTANTGTQNIPHITWYKQPKVLSQIGGLFVTTFILAIGLVAIDVGTALRVVMFLFLCIVTISFLLYPMRVRKKRKNL